MSAFTLRLIACISMLLDHIGYCLHIESLRYIGRLAFPIFVFLMVNGFYHTRSPWKYALRMALFALLSQIPFSLMCKNRIYDAQMNVFITLLLGLTVIWVGETMKKHRVLRYFCLVPAMIVYGLCYYGVIDSDYDSKGILMAVVFWLFRDKPLWMAVGLFLSIWNQNLLSAVFSLMRGAEPGVPTKWQMVQNLSLLSLPLICLYNGKPGRLPQNPVRKKAVQIFFYIFYPLHMLILWFLFVR